MPISVVSRWDFHQQHQQGGQQGQTTQSSQSGQTGQQGQQGQNQGIHEEALRLAREAAPIIKQHGAQQVRFGHVQSGSQTGQCLVITTYQSFEQMGKTLQALHNDQNYNRILNQAHQRGRLVERQIIQIEELT